MDNERAFLNGFALGFALANCEAKADIAATRAEVDAMVEAEFKRLRADSAAAEARVVGYIAEFAQRHGLPLPDELAPRRSVN